MRDRPLSPHLSVYKMTRYSLLTSFSNRISGLVLSAGLLVLVFWLAAAARGPRTYERALSWLTAPIVKLLYVALLIAFAYHLVAGIRHLIWDTGHGLERSQSKASAWLVLAATAVLVVVFGYWLAFGRATAR